MLHDLTIQLSLNVSDLSSNHWDGDFAIDLGPIHALQTQESLQTLGNIQLDVIMQAGGVFSTATITQEYAEDRMRWILEPWNKRGILNVRGRNGWWSM